MSDPKKKRPLPTSTKGSEPGPVQKKQKGEEQASKAPAKKSTDVSSHSNAQQDETEMKANLSDSKISNPKKDPLLNLAKNSAKASSSSSKDAKNQKPPNAGKEEKKQKSSSAKKKKKKKVNIDSGPNLVLSMMIIGELVKKRWEDSKLDRKSAQHATVTEVYFMAVLNFLGFDEAKNVQGLFNNKLRRLKAIRRKLCEQIEILDEKIEHRIQKAWEAAMKASKESKQTVKDKEKQLKQLERGLSDAVVQFREQIHDSPDSARSILQFSTLWLKKQPIAADFLTTVADRLWKACMRDPRLHLQWSWALHAGHPEVEFIHRILAADRKPGTRDIWRFLCLDGAVSFAKVLVMLQWDFTTGKIRGKRLPLLKNEFIGQMPPALYKTEKDKFTDPQSLINASSIQNLLLDIVISMRIGFLEALASVDTSSHRLEIGHLQDVLHMKLKLARRSRTPRELGQSYARFAHFDHLTLPANDARDWLLQIHGKIPSGGDSSSIIPLEVKMNSVQERSLPSGETISWFNQYPGSLGNSWCSSLELLLHTGTTGYIFNGYAFQCNRQYALRLPFHLLSEDTARTLPDCRLKPLENSPAVLFSSNTAGNALLWSTEIGPGGAKSRRFMSFFLPSPSQKFFGNAGLHLTPTRIGDLLKLQYQYLANFTKDPEYQLAVYISNPRAAQSRMFRLIVDANRDPNIHFDFRVVEYFHQQADDFTAASVFGPTVSLFGLGKTTAESLAKRFTDPEMLQKAAMFTHKLLTKPFDPVNDIPAGFEAVGYMLLALSDEKMLQQAQPANASSNSKSSKMEEDTNIQGFMDRMLDDKDGRFVSGMSHPDIFLASEINDLTRQIELTKEKLSQLATQLNSLNQRIETLQLVIKNPPKNDPEGEIHRATQEITKIEKELKPELDRKLEKGNQILERAAKRKKKIEAESEEMRKAEEESADENEEGFAEAEEEETRKQQMEESSSSSDEEEEEEEQEESKADEKSGKEEKKELTEEQKAAAAKEEKKKLRKKERKLERRAHRYMENESESEEEGEEQEEEKAEEEEDDKEATHPYNTFHLEGASFKDYNSDNLGIIADAVERMSKMFGESQNPLWLESHKAFFAKTLTHLLTGDVEQNILLRSRIPELVSLCKLNFAATSEFAIPRIDALEAAEDKTKVDAMHPELLDLQTLFAEQEESLPQEVLAAAKISELVAARETGFRRQLELDATRPLSVGQLRQKVATFVAQATAEKQQPEAKGEKSGEVKVTEDALIKLCEEKSSFGDEWLRPTLVWLYGMHVQSIRRFLAVVVSKEEEASHLERILRHISLADCVTRLDDGFMRKTPSKVFTAHLRYGFFSLSARHLAGFLGRWDTLQKKQKLSEMGIRAEIDKFVSFDAKYNKEGKPNADAAYFIKMLQENNGFRLSAWDPNALAPKQMNTNLMVEGEEDADETSAATEFLPDIYGGYKPLDWMHRASFVDSLVLTYKCAALKAGVIVRAPEVQDWSVNDFTIFDVDETKAIFWQRPLTILRDLDDVLWRYIDLLELMINTKATIGKGLIVNLIGNLLETREQCTKLIFDWKENNPRPPMEQLADKLLSVEDANSILNRVIRAEAEMVLDQLDLIDAADIKLKIIDQLSSQTRRLPLLLSHDHLAEAKALDGFSLDSEKADDFIYFYTKRAEDARDLAMQFWAATRTADYPNVRHSIFGEVEWTIATYSVYSEYLQQSRSLVEQLPPDTQEAIYTALRGEAPKDDTTWKEEKGEEENMDTTTDTKRSGKDEKLPDDEGDIGTKQHKSKKIAENDDSDENAMDTRGRVLVRDADDDADVESVNDALRKLLLRNS